MKRLLALVLGGLGLRAWVRRRHRHSESPPLEQPAEDLRQKLAESRATAEAQLEDPDPAETPVDDRRADVHARARQTIDELRDGGE